jgi:sialate O-acetylesterase
MRILALVLFVFCVLYVHADVDFKLIGNNMVLQRNSANTRLWGQITSPASSVQVTLLMNGQVIDSYSGSIQNNLWEIKLKQYKAGGPYDIVVKTSVEVKYTNIYFGDVYLCSGQSNMEMAVIQAENGQKEAADSINYPRLHLFHIQQNDQAAPVNNVVGQWLPSSPQAIGGTWTSGFSATCYFYGREIYKLFNGTVPIGLIESNWGGTRVEAWMSPDARAKCNDTDSNDPNQASHLWNGMIVPLLKYNIKGAIWYQGESNAGAYARYICSFPAMITDWRAKWGIGDFPFYFVQIAGWAPGGENFANIRLSQLAALKLPNTGFATAIDIGDPQDIHPIYKQAVGYRLFLNAKNLIYGYKTVQYKGPSLQGVGATTTGNKVTFKFVFDNADGGLIAKGTPKCTKCCTNNQETFQVRTNQRTNYFNPDTVTITGTDNISIVVTLQNADEKITNIRYAMYGYPECIFHAKNSDLPMPPFTTNGQ